MLVNKKNNAHSPQFLTKFRMKKVWKQNLVSNSKQKALKIATMPNFVTSILSFLIFLLMTTATTTAFKPNILAASPSQSFLDAIFPQDFHGGAETQTSFGPPVDSLYELTVKIPVIGRQRFSLHIQSNSIAELQIQGPVINVSDRIEYKVNHETGELEFELSDGIHSTLRKVRTKLNRVSYCWKTDTPSVEVKPPLPTSINLKLKRISSRA